MINVTVSPDEEYRSFLIIENALENAEIGCDMRISEDSLADNEKLIEGIRETGDPAHPLVLRGWAELSVKDIAVLRAYIEKAHTPKVTERHNLVMPIYGDTPTDDEREALRIAELDARQAAYRQDRTDWYVDHEQEPEITTNAFFRGWDAAVDGRFRRSEVPEPSAECTCPNALGWHTTDCPANRNNTPEPETSEAHADSRGFWDGVRSVRANRSERFDELTRERDHHGIDPEPQGEPSDAQVREGRDAAKSVHDSFFGNVGPRDDVWDAIVRAALRAANGVR